MNLVAKRLTGIAFGGLGAALLTVALEQALGSEPPREAFTQAAVASCVGAVLLGLGILVAILVGATAERGEKLKMIKLAVVLFATPAGIAFSLAASLVFSAVAAAVLLSIAVWVVPVVGIFLVAVGIFINRNFWLDLAKAILAALKSTGDDPNSSSNGVAFN